MAELARVDEAGVPLNDTWSNYHRAHDWVAGDSSGILRLDEGSATPGVAGPPKDQI